MRGIILSAVALSLVGCVHTSIVKLARHEVGGEPRITSAPKTAVYKVKWTDRPGGDFAEVPQTQRIVRAGERIGFATTQSYGVVAIAGDEQFVMPNLPAQARYCVWYVREQRPTQFAREVGKAMKTSGEIAGTAAVVGLAVGVTALDAWAESQADDCATDGYHERNRHHHRNTEHQSPTTRPVRK